MGSASLGPYSPGSSAAVVTTTVDTSQNVNLTITGRLAIADTEIDCARKLARSSVRRTRGARMTIARSAISEVPLGAEPKTGAKGIAPPMLRRAIARATRSSSPSRADPRLSRG